MVPRFAKLSPEIWRTMQFGAGILLIDTNEVELSDYEKLRTAQYANILGATTGGLNIAVIPNFIDLSLSGLNNVHELSVIRNYNVNITGRMVSVTQDTLQVLVGSGKVTPIVDVDAERVCYRVQFNNPSSKPANIWWVGNYGNDIYKDAGGYIAIHMRNALSKEGFSLQTTHAARGEFTFSFEAMYSVADVNSKDMPLEVYFYTAQYFCFMVKKDTGGTGYDPFYVKASDNDTNGVFFKIVQESIEEELRTPIFS